MVWSGFSSLTKGDFTNFFLVHTQRQPGRAGAALRCSNSIVSYLDDDVPVRSVVVPGMGMNLKSFLKCGV